VAAFVIHTQLLDLCLLSLQRGLGSLVFRDLRLMLKGFDMMRYIFSIYDELTAA
jgi:hypothetical protein